MAPVSISDTNDIYILISIIYIIYCMHPPVKGIIGNQLIATLIVTRLYTFVGICIWATSAYNKADRSVEAAAILMGPATHLPVDIYWLPAVPCYPVTVDIDMVRQTRFTGPTTFQHVFIGIIYASSCVPTKPTPGNKSLYDIYAYRVGEVSVVLLIFVDIGASQGNHKTTIIDDHDPRFNLFTQP